MYVAKLVNMLSGYTLLSNTETQTIYSSIYS